METLSAKMKKTSLMPRWWKKRFTAVITESDPSFKVVYLGNVLTGWAKGILDLYLLHIFAVALCFGGVFLPLGVCVINYALNKGVSCLRNGCT